MEYKFWTIEDVELAHHYMEMTPAEQEDKMPAYIKYGYGFICIVGADGDMVEVKTYGHC